MTQNPADEEHWTEEVAVGPDVLEEDPESGLSIVKKVFRIPYGENKELNPLARLANRAAFKSDPGKFARYVEGRAAPVQKGRAVTPEYNPAIHFMADYELPVVPGAPGVRFYDAWHHPVIILGQQVNATQLYIHHVLYGSEVGIKELIENEYVPLMETHKYKGKIENFRDIGDPTMKTPDQSTVGMSAAKRVEQILKTRFEPGPTRWQYRIDPLKTALGTLNKEGQPLIKISKSAYALHRALNGGWHWKVDNSGNRTGSLPVQGEKFGDIGNALAYGVAVLYPYRRIMPEQGIGVKKYDPMRRAMSYAVRRSVGLGPSAAA